MARKTKKQLAKEAEQARAELSELWGFDVPELALMPSWMMPFLEAYPDHGSIVGTCRAVPGMTENSRINVSFWLHKKGADEDGVVEFFRKAFAIVKVLAVDSIRSEIKRRGIDGTELVDEEYEYFPVLGSEDDGSVEFEPRLVKRKVRVRTSDTMLALLARINDPEARTSNVDVTSKGEGLSNLTVFVPQRDADPEEA